MIVSTLVAGRERIQLLLGMQFLSQGAVVVLSNT